MEPKQTLQVGGRPANRLLIWGVLSILVAHVGMVPAYGAGTPVIGVGGIVNAATFRSAEVPGGDIAQGSIFSIFGVDIGPAVGVTVTAFPLENNLGGVEITVTPLGGGATLNAIPLFVLGSQINAIMPSNTPIGLVDIRVICDGVMSVPETVRVVSTSVGIFTAMASGAGPGIITDLNFALNTRTSTATPSQIMIIWATGLGGISGPDNIAPIDSPPLRDFKDEIDDFEVLVGGRPVTQIFYAGRSAANAALDQIVVELAPDVVLGCFVPVLVFAEGVLSNSVTMATNADGQPCSDPDNPLLTTATEGGRVATIALTRLEVFIDLATLGLASLPAPEEKGFGTILELKIDTAIASFQEIPPLDGVSFNPLVNLPPVGTCITFSTAGIDLDAILATDVGGAEARPLDAGDSFTITRLSDMAVRTVNLGDSIDLPILGEDPPLISDLLDIPATPLFLNPGRFRLEGDGGAEVDPWSVDVTLPPEVMWTNQASFGMINRGSDKQFTWIGGNDTQYIEAVGINLVGESAVGFACLAHQTAGSLTVPSEFLSVIPASTPLGPEGELTSIGLVFFGATQYRDLPTIDTNGLDRGVVIPVWGSFMTASFL